MTTSIWSRVIEWFRDRSDRGTLIKSFNKAAKEAFINGYAPRALKASSSKGLYEYKHEFSALFNTGFRIEVLSGYSLSQEDMKRIGFTIISDVELVRRLVVLGWDTLEIHDDTRTYGCRWKLVDYAQLGRVLNEFNEE